MTTLVGCLLFQVQLCPYVSSENNVILLFPEHPIFHSNNILNLENLLIIKVHLNNSLAVFIAKKSVMSLKVSVLP